MSFETDAVSIDFSSVLSGKLSLKQPTQAVAQITLSEAGINHAFKAELVKSAELIPAYLTDLSGRFLEEVHLELLPNNANLGSGRLYPPATSCRLALQQP